MRKLFIALMFLNGCALSNEQIEIDMRGGKTFCEAYPEVPYCGEQAEGFREDE